MLIPLAAISALAVVFTHWRMGQFVRGRTVWLRAFLVLVGTGLGIVMMGIPEQGSGVLGFVTGFGLAHVPPAIVLMLKGWRGEGRS